MSSVLYLVNKMTTSGFDVFDKTIHKTNSLLKHIETELGWEKHRNMSYAALRGVLHALRDRLTVQESADLAAQLPLLVKGIYYDGWNPSNIPKKVHKDEFLEEIKKNFTFSLDRNINEIVVVVSKVLRKHVSEGELEDVLSVLPKDLSSMLTQLE